MAAPQRKIQPQSNADNSGPALEVPKPSLHTLGGMMERVTKWLADHSDNSLMQRAAGTVFLVRVASALLALVSQVLMARWMGSFEFGVYVYVWTWVLMIGALSDCGLSLAARRFVPEYTEGRSFDHLRGFLAGSRWLAVGLATAIAIVGAFGVTLLTPWFDHYLVIPLYLACVCIPIYGLAQAQAGIAHAYDQANLAVMPFYIWRQLTITAALGAAYFLGFATDAVTAMQIAVGATWAVTVGQMFVLNRRLREKVPPGRRHYEPRTWLRTSLPLFVVDFFYLLLTFSDILVLERFSTPDEIAKYYAAARILAIVAFVYFAIAGATTHKFAQYHVTGDSKRLASFFAEAIKLTFWPSLAACAGILLLGKPLLALFGEQFVAAYPVMFLLSVGMLARAALGPAEPLLNMLGRRRELAMIYAVTFVLNVALCCLLIPRFGIEGAAASTSAALVLGSIAVFVVAKRKLGIHVFILGGAR